MEKFARFRDQSTGVAPFMLRKTPRHSYDYSNLVLLYLLAPISLLLTPLTTLLFVFVVGSLPFGIDRVYLRYIYLLILRVYVDVSKEGDGRVSVRRKPSQWPQAGDVVICNFTGPLDVVALASQRRTQFIVPAGSGFERLSLNQAVSRALEIPPASGTSRGIDEIVKSARENRAVIVLFPEGTTSNGQGILTTKSCNWSALAASPIRVYTAAIRHDPTGGAEAPLPITRLAYLWRLATSSLWHRVSIKYSAGPLQPSATNQRGVAESLSNLGRLRIVEDRLDVVAKQDYTRALAKRR